MLTVLLTGKDDIFVLNPAVRELINISAAQAVSEAPVLYTGHNADSAHLNHLFELLFGLRLLYRTCIWMSTKIERIF